MAICRSALSYMRIDSNQMIEAGYDQNWLEMDDVKIIPFYAWLAEGFACM